MLTLDNLPDIRSIEPDLFTPQMTIGEPEPGKRVKIVNPEYKGTEVYHTLYLPKDWQKDKKYPVVVEYAGNGPYKNGFGDICTGKVSDSNLGYGISGGKGFIWVCLPYISEDHKKNQLQWWGDVEATVEYCKRTIPYICIEYGGNPFDLIITGFSRGAIACNYIGLHDDEIASLWFCFIAHSHYDGVYLEDDRESALKRLERLKGRPQFISHEGSTSRTQEYIKSTGIDGDFTFMDIPYRNHTDSWVLRDIPERKILRKWLASTKS
jgi:hypothetical protein